MYIREAEIDVACDINLSTFIFSLFEIEADFPKDYLLSIQVWDYDTASSDDFIGETKIDLENRFYSSHRAHCGIARTYDATGYNAWRDRERPCQILELVCKRNNLASPVYNKDFVAIGNKKFPCYLFDNDSGKNNNNLI